MSCFYPKKRRKNFFPLSSPLRDSHEEWCLLPEERKVRALFLGNLPLPFFFLSFLSAGLVTRETPRSAGPQNGNSTIGLPAAQEFGPGPSFSFFFFPCFSSRWYYRSSSPEQVEIRAMHLCAGICDLQHHAGAVERPDMSPPFPPFPFFFLFFLFPPLAGGAFAGSHEGRVYEAYMPGI